MNACDAKNGKVQFSHNFPQSCMHICAMHISDGGSGEAGAGGWGGTLLQIIHFGSSVKDFLNEACPWLS